MINEDSYEALVYKECYGAFLPMVRIPLKGIRVNAEKYRNDRINGYEPSSNLNLVDVNEPAFWQATSAHR